MIVVGMATTKHRRNVSPHLHAWEQDGGNEYFDDTVEHIQHIQLIVMYYKTLCSFVLLLFHSWVLP